MNEAECEFAHWNKDLALLWTRNLPPCRPSFSEMYIYTKYLRKKQKKYPDRKIQLLILGSSAEFRDWGHQENMNVTIIDCSEEYHNTIKREMKHKHAEETLILNRWQDMSFHKEFDLIVGDLIIGNLYPNEVPPFLERIKDALMDDGYFMTKSFFRKDLEEIKSLDRIFKDY